MNHPTAGISPLPWTTTPPAPFTSLGRRCAARRAAPSAVVRAWPRPPRLGLAWRLLGAPRWRRAAAGEIGRGPAEHDPSVNPVSQIPNQADNRPLTCKNAVSEEGLATYVHDPDRPDRGVCARGRRWAITGAAAAGRGIRRSVRAKLPRLVEHPPRRPGGRPIGAALSAVYPPRFLAGA